MTGMTLIKGNSQWSDHFSNSNLSSPNSLSQWTQSRLKFVTWQFSAWAFATCRLTTISNHRIVRCDLLKYSSPMPASSWEMFAYTQQDTLCRAHEKAREIILKLHAFLRSLVLSFQVETKYRILKTVSTVCYLFLVGNTWDNYGIWARCLARRALLSEGNKQSDWYQTAWG
jgi:hypothetical protein